MTVWKKIMLASVLTAIPLIAIVYNNFIRHTRGWHSMLIQYHSFFWLTRLLVAPILVVVAVQAWQKVNQLSKLFLYPPIIFFFYNGLCWFISFIGCRRLAPGFDGRDKNLFDTIMYESTLLNLIVYIATLLLVFSWLHYEQNVASKQKTIDLETSLEKTKLDLKRIQNSFVSSSEDKRPGNIVVKNGHKMILIPFGEITCFQSKGAYINIITETGSYLLKKTLSELEKTLPGSFIRVHRSSVVNIEFVKEVRSLLNGDASLLLKNDKEIRLSRTYREHVTAMLSSC